MSVWEEGGGGGPSVHVPLLDNVPPIKCKIEIIG